MMDFTKSLNTKLIKKVKESKNVLGQRVKPTLNNGKRTLHHYGFEGLDMEDEYESRGFIATSFINGLNPKEFYFHSMSGREGKFVFKLYSFNFTNFYIFDHDFRLFGYSNVSNLIYSLIFLY